MKVLELDLKKGLGVLLIETYEDLWHLTNIIEPGDLVEALTPRHVFIEREGKKVKSEKRLMMLKLRVEKVEYHEQLNKLRVLGTIVEGPENVRLGAYHTIELSPGMKVRIEKEWKFHHLERLRRAKLKSVPVALVVVDETRATFAMVKGEKVEIIKEIDNPYSLQDEKQEVFHKSIATEIEKLKDSVAYIVIAGPGFTKEHVVKILLERQKELREKVIPAFASSATISGINELLKSGILQKVKSNLEISREIGLIQKLFMQIHKGSKKVTYGLESCRKAAEIGAIEVLLVSDKLIKNEDIEELAKKVEKSGGKVQIISSSHDLGNQFFKFCGIAAFLRFSVE